MVIYRDEERTQPDRAFSCAASGGRIVAGKPGLDPIEHASRDEIAALQLERLKWTLSHAYQNVPHYKIVFDAAGVHPEDLQQLSDIARFPFTTKRDPRDNYPFGMFRCPARARVVDASSGTTGKPTGGLYRARDLDGQ